MNPSAINTTPFADSLKSLIRAGSPCILIETAETERVDTCLEQLAHQQAFQIREWNLGYGWVSHSTQQSLQSSACASGLASGLALLVDDDLTNSLIVIKQAGLALAQDSLAVARLQLLLGRIQRHHTGQAAVILISEQIELPRAIETLTARLPLPLPQRIEISQLIEDYCQRNALILPPEFLTPMCNGCAGLTHRQIVQVMTMLTHTQPNIDDAAITLILHEKERIIASSGVLEMVRVHETIEDIGGLEDLKKWLKERATLIHRLPEAQAFGITPPKGVLIAGMPGCGKSLTAKVAAALFKLPLLRLDIGSLLGKYVGESEHNMRRALHLAEAISPCILWVDELEKAFVGMNSSNASEVTSRLLGFFLTWLQEKTGAVFVIATANDITALPPELLRKGRFDETFYVGFPNRQERLDILNIHLQRAGKDVTAYDLEKLAIQCRDYCGADIQNAINLALEQAFIAQVSLSQQHLEEGINHTVCLRETLREQVGKYEALFEKLKLKSASRQVDLSVAQMIKLADDPNVLKREKVATSHDCPQDLLEKLAEDSELSVRKAVLKHPYCPEKVLVQRINQFVKNEKPSKEDIELFELVVANTHVPHDLLSSKINDSLDVAVFSENTLIKMSKLRGIDAIGITKIFHHLKTHENIESHTHGNIARKSVWKMQLLASEIYKEPLPSDIQKNLSTDKDEIIRETLAGYTHLDEAVQLTLTKDLSEDVRIFLAGNSNLTEAAQIKLAKDKKDVVRHALLHNPNLCPVAQCKLDKDGNIFLAMNPGLSEATQLRLIERKDENIAKILAGHPKLTEQAQIILINKSFRYSFDRYDREFIEKLVKNSNISEAALLRIIELYINDYHHSGEDTRRWFSRLLANTPYLSEKIQLKFCQESSLYGYSADIAKRLDLTDLAQQLLAETTYGESIWVLLAAHPHLNETSQIILAEKNDVKVNRILAANLNLTTTIQLQLADSSDATRKILASNPRLSEPAQLILAADKEESVRIELALNPNLCAEARLKLAADVYGVRCNLERNPEKYSSHSALADNLSGAIQKVFGYER